MEQTSYHVKRCAILSLNTLFTLEIYAESIALLQDMIFQTKLKILGGGTGKPPPLLVAHITKTW